MMKTYETSLVIIAAFTILMTIFITVYFWEMKKLDVEMLKIKTPRHGEIVKPAKTIW